MEVSDIYISIYIYIDISIYIYFVKILPVGRDSDWLRSGWSGGRIPVEPRLSAPVQTDHGAHPAYYTMGTGSFSGEGRPKVTGACC
jgi:hypothetical protein